MIGTLSFQPKRGGFNPRSGPRSVVTPRSPLWSAFRVLTFGTALAAGMTLAAASPAYATSTILATKSISAPVGFHGVCSRYAWACSQSGPARITDSAAMLKVATRINRQINRSVREISDARQYRKREYWALPTARGGDCEDFALLKKRELIKAGIGADRLLIATVLDRRRGAHAVLVLRTNHGDVVLDNLTSKIKSWDRTGYSFLRMQDPRSKSGWRLVMRGGIFS